VEYQKALEVQKRLAPDSLTVATSYNNIGAVLRSQGNLEGALVEYQKALEIEERLAPDSLTVATFYNNIGLVLKSQGDLEGVLVEYQKALEIQKRLAPDSLTVATFYINIGSVLYSQGDLEGALVEYQKALEIRKRLAPNSLTVATSYNNIGLVLYSQGDLEEALKYFGNADSILMSSRLNLVALHPSKLFCLYNMGEIYLAQNLPDRALEYADRVLNVAPDYKWAYVTRGKALLAIGNCEDAIACFDEAVSRSPNFGDAHAGKVEAELALAKQLEHDKKLDDAQMERVAETVASALLSDPASTDSVDENIKRTLKRAASVGRGQRLQEVSDAADSTALQVPKERINDRDDMWATVQYLVVEFEKQKSNFEKSDKEKSEQIEKLSVKDKEKSERIEKLESKLAQHGIRFDKLEVRIDKQEVRSDKQEVRSDKQEVRIDKQEVRIDAVEENLDKIWKEIQQIRVTVDRAIERVIQQRGALSKEQEDRIRKIREDENLTEFFEAFLTELDCIVTMAKAINPDQIDWQPELPLAMSFACMAAQLITLAVTAAEGVPGAASVNKGIAFAFSFVYKVQQKLEYKTIANIASVTQGLKHYDDLLLELALAACEEHSAVIRELPKWNSELGKEFRKNLFRAWADICGFDWDEINDKNVKNKLWEKAKESAKGLLLGRVRFYQASGKKDLILIRKENPEKAELFSHMENDKFIELIGRIRAKGLWDKGKLWLFGGEEVSVDSLTRKLVGGKQPLSPAYCYGRTQGRRILYGFLVKGADEIIKYPKTKEDESQAQAVIRELQKKLSEAEEIYEKKAKKESFLKKLITVERGFASPTAKSND
jgi:tetratricopeptide (TPR) repeat protein